MESLGYLLLYFLRDRLPWQGLKAETEQQKYKLVMEKKTTISVEELCDKQPREIAVYMNHVRSLRFEDRPDRSCGRSFGAFSFGKASSMTTSLIGQ
jgi:hypothetical protein